MKPRIDCLFGCGAPYIGLDCCVCGCKQLTCPSSPVSTVLRRDRRESWVTVPIFVGVKALYRGHGIAYLRARQATKRACCLHPSVSAKDEAFLAVG
jgi:hypothetical protein